MEDTLQVNRRFSSPLVSIADVRCRPNDSACGHEECAPANDIVFPRSGLFVRHASGDSVVADANQVLFFHERETYRVSHPVPGGDDCTVFTFAPEVLREAFGSLHPAALDRPERPFPTSSAPSSVGSFALQHMLREAILNGEPSTIAVEETAAAVLTSVVGNSNVCHGRPKSGRRFDTRRAHRDLADATRALLAARYRERLTLDEVARGVHSSMYHLARVFRHQTGLPIHRYLTRLRLRASLQRMSDGGADLTAIALDVGFASHSHFSHAFRREFGLAPKALRRSSLGRLLRQTSKISKA